jgi:acetyl-CoA acetyltransferase
VQVAELQASFTHEEPVLVEALGLGAEVAVNPSGGPLAANPIMATGLIRVIEAARAIREGRAHRSVGHSSSGPCLQQNLVCVLEGSPDPASRSSSHQEAAASTTSEAPDAGGRLEGND